MKTVYTERIGDALGVVRLEKYGYTYKIKYKGRTVAGSIVYLADKKLAIERMQADLYLTTKQERLF